MCAPLYHCCSSFLSKCVDFCSSASCSCESLDCLFCACLGQPCHDDPRLIGTAGRGVGGMMGDDAARREQLGVEGHCVNGGRGNSSSSAWWRWWCIPACLCRASMPMLCGFAVRCLKREPPRWFESHCSGSRASLQLDPANCRACTGGEEPARKEKGWGGKGKLTICPYPEVVSSTGSADGWQSVSEGVSGSGSVLEEGACSCRCEGGGAFFCDDEARRCMYVCSSPGTD